MVRLVGSPRNTGAAPPHGGPATQAGNSEVTDGPLPAQLGAKGALEVKDLSFRYPAAAEGQLALDHVSFSLPAGGSLAIVGRTGSGKSTLVALLVRLLPGTHSATLRLDTDKIGEITAGEPGVEIV